MSDEVKLEVDKREETKKSRLNSLRRKGKIPAILYGPDIENASIMVDEKDFKQAISTEHGENVLIKMKVGKSDPVTAIIKEIQVHPVTMKIIHIDFCQIKLTEKVVVDVPLEVEGSAPGVKKEGGVLEHIVREVKVKCLPTEIPNKFTLDVSGLEIGSGLTVGDIDVIDEIEIITDPAALAVNVVPPSEVREPAEEELEEVQEPEIIGKEPEESPEETPESEKSAPKPDRQTEE